MSARSVQRVLRIGVIQGGRIVEERLLRKRQKVTVGLSSRNTFVLPLGDLKSHVLFDLQSDRYNVCFTERMGGRLALGDGVADFEDLKSHSLIRRRGDVWTFPLADNTRGKVVLGEVTILFQFVEPPPAPVTPKLPAVARGGWVKSVDWIYTSIILGIGIIEGGLIGYMKTLPPPPKKQPTIENLDKRFARLLVPELMKKPEAPKTPTGAEKLATDKEGEKKAKQPKTRTASRSAARRKGKARAGDAAGKGDGKAAAARAKVARTGMLAAIGTVGEGASEAIADVFSEGRVNRDISSSFRSAEELAYAQSAGGRSRAPKGGGAEGVGNTESIGEEKIGGVGGGGKGVRKVRVRRTVKRTVPKAAMRTGSAEVEGGTLDSGRISSVLRRRRGAVIGCYENALKRDPDLRGKITIRFTIGPTGRVIQISVDRNSMGSQAVARCIVRRVRAFRFPRPQGGSVTVTYPFIFTSTKR